MESYLKTELASIPFIFLEIMRHFDESRKGFEAAVFFRISDRFRGNKSEDSQIHRNPIQIRTSNA